MKRLLFSVFFLLQFSYIFAQYQIEVFTPSTNTTRICPTLDSAYNSALSGDYIYLPAGVFTINYDIAKSLNLIGSGINPDSSITGISIINNQLSFTSGSENSFIEGVKVTSSVSSVSVMLGIGSDSYPVHNISFQRCDFVNIVKMGPANFSTENITFNECVFESAISGGFSNNWNFIKSIFYNGIANLNNSNFYNNIFLYNCVSCYPSMFISVNSSSFYNNIFNGSGGEVISCNSCTFYNNTNPNLYNSSNTISINDLTINADSLFYNNLDISNTNIPYFKRDWHLKPGNPGINGGTDGTDVGIYGTSQPCKLGWIPSNPHIYSKTITVDGSGILHATFKVKPQSN